MKNPITKAVGTAHSATIFRRRATVIARLLGKTLIRNSMVLDVGCGDGTISRMMETGTARAKVDGIDVFVRPNSQIVTQQFDGTTIPLPDKSYDAVTIIDVLHHTNNQLELLTESARVARNQVIIKDHLSESTLDYLTLRAMDWVGNAPHGVILPYNYANRAQWGEWFDAAGLEIVMFTTDLPLYPAPLSWIFGRSLHFVAELRPRS